MFKGHQDGIRVVGNGETLAPPLSVYNNGTAKVFQSRYARNGRGAPSDVVPALAAQSGGTGPGGPAGDEAYNLTLQAGVRRLTPTECERLQGFPDGWTAGQADAHRYRQMGNAVCVPVVEWIGRRAVAWLEGRRLEALDG